MTILDIDQDFFFSPIFYGGLSSKYAANKASVFRSMKLVCAIEDVLKKFNIRSALPGKVLVNHSELHRELQQLGLAKIIHLDAHSDIYFYNQTETSASFNEGNFLLRVVEDGLCNEIDWIREVEPTDEEDIKLLRAPDQLQHFGHSFSFRKYRLQDYRSSDTIDHIYYTLSPNFCPPNLDLVNQIRKYIKK
jgi:hypothetical protein